MLEKLEEFKKNISKRGFTITLEDPYCYPAAKDFVFPDVYVMQAAIENYCLRHGLTMEYISKEKPITFLVDGKRKYEAKLELVKGRFYSGYAVYCEEVL